MARDDVERPPRRATTLVALNALGLALTLSGVASVSAIAAVVHATRSPGLHRGDAVRDLLHRVRRTFLRDLPMSLALVLLVGLGAVTVASLFANGDGRLGTGLSVALGLLCLVAALQVTAYTHAAGTLDESASRRDVMRLAGARLARAPGASLAALGVTLLAALAWVAAPVALLVGLVVPAALHNRLWRRVDADLLVFVEVDEGWAGL